MAKSPLVLGQNILLHHRKGGNFGTFLYCVRSH